MLLLGINIVRMNALVHLEGLGRNFVFYFNFSFCIKLFSSFLYKFKEHALLVYNFTLSIK